ncbi:MAG: hypothetical protein ACE5JR_07075 [Gemmatimonadota bacterium]
MRRGRDIHRAGALGLRTFPFRPAAVATALLWLGGAGFFGSIPSRGESDPFRLDGRDYLSWSSEVREAYVAGFLAGAATAQALRGTAALEQELDRLRAAGELPLPEAPHEYAASLAGYYASPDRVETRLVSAMSIARARLRGSAIPRR